ncbi:hypothetical protein F4604DRAFT_1678671 [Suillus subluteus]|nr:hypothetical protein F4604DRAFT_1678671 [Suillus subluteus]
MRLFSQRVSFADASLLSTRLFVPRVSCVDASLKSSLVTHYGLQQEHRQEIHWRLSPTHPPQHPQAPGLLGVDSRRRKALTRLQGFDRCQGHLAYGRWDLANTSVHNEYCIVCRDGAGRYEENTLFMTTSLSGAFVATSRWNKAGAYFGFYNANHLPVLDMFLPINGALEVSERAEISAATVIFIHLILVDFTVAGSPMEFAHSFLKPYYTGDHIHYLNVYYDIGTDAKLPAYRSNIQKIMKGLKKSFVWERVVIASLLTLMRILETLFLGAISALRSNDFLEIILQPWQTLIDAAQESYLWMFCCGHLVTNLDSFHGLQEAVVRHKLTGTIAFNAPRFQPSFASHLLIAFTERVLIGRCPLRLAFKDMLAQACDLGRHSDIYLLTPVKEGALTCSRFAWANVEFRPWGHRLPIQCSGCGWANSWRSAYVKGSKDKAYIFECKNDSCNAVLDEHEISYVSAKGNPAERAKILKSIKDAILESDQAKDASTMLPGNNIRKAIRTYYLRFLEDDEDRDLEQKIIEGA